jgi:uncharacterized protein YjbI with pentapeptide repeats
MTKKLLIILPLIACCLFLSSTLVLANTTKVNLVLFSGKAFIVDLAQRRHSVRIGQEINIAQFPSIEIGERSRLFLQSGNKLVRLNTAGSYQIKDLLENKSSSIENALLFLAKLSQPRTYIIQTRARGERDLGTMNEKEYFETLWEGIAQEPDQESTDYTVEELLAVAAWYQQNNKPARVAYTLERLNSLKQKRNSFYNQLRVESMRGITISEINRELKFTRQRIEARNSILQYKALLIGINKYDNPEWQHLKNPISDVRAIKEVLIKKYHFDQGDIVLLENATYDQIINSFQTLKRTTREDTSLLVFFAGHGYYPADEGEGYWIPRDAGKPLSQRLFLPTSTILGKMKALKVKHTLLIADSCFSGSLIRKTRGSAVDSRFYLDLSKKKSRQIITSGGLEPVSDQGGGNHSIFAGKLLQILSKEYQEPLSASELALELRKEVKNAGGAQTPEYGRLQIADDENGEFFFVQKDRRLKKAKIRKSSTPPVTIQPKIKPSGYSYANLPKGYCIAPKPFTDLRHCKFRGKRIKKISFEGTNLEDVDFRYILADEVNFKGANLINTDWRYSKFDTMTFSYAVLNESDWRYVIITDSDFSHSQMRGTDIRFASLSDVNLDYSDLTNANIQSVNLDDVTFEGAILANVRSDANQLIGNNEEEISSDEFESTEAESAVNSSIKSSSAISRTNRDNSILYLGITPFGLSGPTLRTYPVSAGIYIGDSLLVGLEYGVKTEEKSTSTTETSVSLRSAGVYFRFFPGNSFSLLFSIDQRAWLAESTIQPSASGKTIVSDTETVYVGTFGIGNYWLLDSGVTVGCDWGLISSKVGTIESTREIEDDGGSGIQEHIVLTTELADDIEKDSFFSDGAFFVNFRIGWSF